MCEFDGISLGADRTFFNKSLGDVGGFDPVLLPLFMTRVASREKYSSRVRSVGTYCTFDLNSPPDLKGTSYNNAEYDRPHSGPFDSRLAEFSYYSVPQLFVQTTIFGVPHLFVHFLVLDLTNS
jgi:hypothetical protein